MEIILLLSLICCLLSAIQTYTAIYYVMADLLMLGMYTYYKVKNRVNQGECFSLFSVSLGHCKSNWIRATTLPFILRLLIAWSGLNGSKSILFYSVMMSSCFSLRCGLTFHPVTPVSLSDRRILHVVGVACVLGFTASFAQLPGSSGQQEMIPSDFKSRSLLWTTDGSGIRVSLVYYLIRVQKIVSPSSDVFIYSSHHFRFLPPERSSVSPSALCPLCSTSAPDSLKYTLM